MVEMLEMALGFVVGVAVLAGVFWFAFASPPSRRSDGGMTQHDAENYFSGHDSGGHSS